MIIYKESFLNAVENNSRDILKKCSRGMFQNVLCECSLNVPTKSSTNVRYKCSLNVPMEGSRNVLFERSLNIPFERSWNVPQEHSENIALERSKNPDIFLVLGTFLERSDGTFRTFHGNVQGRYCAVGEQLDHMINMMIIICKLLSMQNKILCQKFMRSKKRH